MVDTRAFAEQLVLDTALANLGDDLIREELEWLGVDPSDMEAVLEEVNGHLDNAYVVIEG